nr:hypothetical protein [Tanacetum cinerariifolium]
PTKPHHIPSPEALQTSSTTPSSPTLPSITIVLIPTVTLSETTPIRQYTRRARISQSPALPPVADELASPLRDVSEGAGNQQVEGQSQTVGGAPIKGRNLDEGKAAAERVSDDSKEMATVLTSMDAATVLASGVAEVPTGSRSIPTVGPPAAEVPTAGLIFATSTVVTSYTR